jgi:predicted HD phosphohydrolase
MHHYDQDRNARERLTDSPYYQSCVDFCAKWDQTSFDPDYQSQNLKYFIPMVKKIFARKPDSHV